MKKVLVIGSGGREHALAWKLAMDSKVCKVYCAPGNGGTQNIAQNVDLKINNFNEIYNYVEHKRIDMIVVGPEAPLNDGIVDFFKEKDIKILHKKALKEKIHFAVTPFDISFVDFLNRYVTFFKVASGDLNYFPLLEKISKYKKPVILSTGMSNFKEIREALKILKKNQVALLHCISAYPTNDSDLNLSTLVKLKKQLGFETKGKGQNEVNKTQLAAIQQKFPRDYKRAVDSYVTKAYRYLSANPVIFFNNNRSTGGRLTGAAGNLIAVKNVKKTDVMIDVVTQGGIKPKVKL